MRSARIVSSDRLLGFRLHVEGDALYLPADDELLRVTDSNAEAVASVPEHWGLAVTPPTCWFASRTEVFRARLDRSQPVSLGEVGGELEPGLVTDETDLFVSRLIDPHGFQLLRRQCDGADDWTPLYTLEQGDRYRVVHADDRYVYCSTEDYSCLELRSKHDGELIDVHRVPGAHSLGGPSPNWAIESSRVYASSRGVVYRASAPAVSAAGPYGRDQAPRAVELAPFASLSWPIYSLAVHRGHVFAVIGRKPGWFFDSDNRALVSVSPEDPVPRELYRFEAKHTSTPLAVSDRTIWLVVDQRTLLALPR